MRKLLTTTFLLILIGAFGQINDELRQGSTKRSGAKRTNRSNTPGSTGVGGGVSAGDIGLLIDACGCLYDVGILFFSDVVVEGVRKNTALIKERRDTLPRIKNLEFNFGYGVFPDSNSTYLPKLRLQAGVIGTSFRALAIQDRQNPFFKDILTFYDWQILEFNVLNTHRTTVRFGGGFSWDGASEFTSIVTEVTAGADVYFGKSLRWNLEGRYTPFGEIKFRREVNTRLYFRPSDRKKFHFEVFGGALYANYFDAVTLFSAEVGAGFMIY